MAAVTLTAAISAFVHCFAEQWFWMLGDPGFSLMATDEVDSERIRKQERVQAAQSKKFPVPPGMIAFLFPDA